jgi:hypothetical protein
MRPRVLGVEHIHRDLRRTGIGRNPVGKQILGRLFDFDPRERHDDRLPVSPPSTAAASSSTTTSADTPSWVRGTSRRANNSLRETVAATGVRSIAFRYARA